MIIAETLADGLARDTILTMERLGKERLFSDVVKVPGGVFLSPAGRLPDLDPGPSGGMAQRPVSEGHASGGRNRHSAARRPARAGCGTVSDRLTAQFAFLNEADKLKQVLRATTLVDASRPENPGEHS